MTYQYRTSGVCSQLITIELDDDNKTIKDIAFLGGCNGNLKGLSALAKGKNIDEVIDTLSGITCGPRPTSCPDQLARALKEMKEEL